MLARHFNSEINPGRPVRGREVYIDNEYKLFIVTGQPSPRAGFLRDMVMTGPGPTAEDRTYPGLVSFDNVMPHEFDALSGLAALREEKSRISVKINAKDHRLEYLDEIAYTVSYVNFSMLDSGVNARLNMQIAHDRSGLRKFAR